LEALEFAEAAGLPVAEKALRLLTSPRRRLLGREGLARLCELTGPHDPALPSELRLALIDLAAELGEHGVVVGQAEALTAQVESPSLLARARLAASRALIELGRLSEAEKRLIEASRLPIDDPALRIEILAQQSVVERMRGRGEEAWSRAWDAVEAARSLVASAHPAGVSAQVRALVAAADAAIFTGDPVAMAALN
jgi:hypothetical protein